MFLKIVSKVIKPLKKCCRKDIAPDLDFAPNTCF